MAFIMAKITLVILATSVIVITTACSSNCRDTSDCQTSISCCETNCQSTQCQSSSGCTNNCETSRCCQNSCQSCKNTCNSGCRSNGCAARCVATSCGEKCRTNGETSTSNNTETTTKPSILPTPSANNNNNNNVTNFSNGTFTTTLNLNNNVNLVNNISVPITITSDSKVYISIVQSTAVLPEQFNCSSKPHPESCPTTSTGKNSTIVERIPVPIPYPSKPIYIPVPHPVIVSPPRREGCCLTVNPCRRNDNNCAPYTHTCGNDCMYKYQYSPSNPCSYDSGCRKSSYAISYSCFNSGYCQTSPVDCNYCDDSNFYANYNNYRQCGGCYYK